MPNFSKLMIINGKLIRITPRSNPKIKFLAYVNKNGPVFEDLGNCWLWTGGRVGSYGNFKSIEGGGGYAHRSSWVIHNGPISEGLQVLHKCDNPICVNPEHLFLGTAKDNMADCANKGRTKNQFSQLTKRQVIEIREVCLPLLSNIAQRFDVPVHVICDLLAGRTYRSKK